LFAIFEQCRYILTENLSRKGGIMRRWLILGLVGLLIGLAIAPGPKRALARSAITASDDRAVVQFPEKVVFEVDLQSEAEIDEIVLEYGVEQLTCGTVVAKAFPDFTPSRDVEASWEWEMKQSGSEPPGATIWWRWHATDADGNELLTDIQTTTWLDDEHNWGTVEGDSINLHWYEGSRTFAEGLHAAAVDALVYIDENMGLEPDGPIDIYVYGSFGDLRDAMYYEPGWIGGQAYTNYNIVVVGVPPDDADSLEWGRDVEVHELTHVLVHRFTFSCLFSLPTWLDEGLSEFTERGEDGLGADRADFEAAVADDTLFSVRALGGSFPEDSEKAHLAYVQSYSLVDFLITEYGRDEIVALLAALRDGEAIDDALQAAYGFDQDGLEDAWREHIDAAPRVTEGAEPTPTPTPTMVPTLEPISGVPLATVIPVQPTATPTPSPEATRAPAPIPDDTPTATPVDDTGGVSNLMIGGGAAIVVVAVCVTGVIVLVLAVIIVRRRREGV
jgi:hypothetical protein